MYQDLRNRSNNKRLIHIAGTADVARSIFEADIIILHILPNEIEEIYNLFPEIKAKYVICFLVWETNELVEKWKTSFNLIQEVWTPSHYCYNIFSKYHNKVTYIPHVIEREISYTDSDLSLIKDVIKYKTDHVYYLAIAAVEDKRKNVHTLVKAFLQASDNMAHAKLIIKSCWPTDPQNLKDPRLIYLRRDFTYAELNALYDISDVYVSAHHSEGWGLTLSDAMLFNKPVIATAYSGNLEFMNEENSFLVRYEEKYIEPEDTDARFQQHMKWAYPNQIDLQEKIILFYNNRQENWVAQKTRRAFEETKKYSSKIVGDLIEERLDQLRVLLQPNCYFL